MKYIIRKEYPQSAEPYWDGCKFVVEREQVKKYDSADDASRDLMEALRHTYVGVVIAMDGSFEIPPISGPV